jgi:hypothetical protein
MDLPSLPGRVRLLLKGRLPGPTVVWASRAAAGFEQQLRDSDAFPHRTVTEAIARSLRIPRGKREILGGALDLLQTAFDLADNIADREQDVGAGRNYTAHYGRIPEAALVCMPALLTSSAVQILHEAFPKPSYAPRFAGQRLIRVLGDMVAGQGTSGASRRRVALVSGKQGLLLCLPFWLVAARGPRGKKRLAIVENWAFRFGCTWEYRQAHLDRPTVARKRALELALASVQRAWPSFSPFLAGEPLASDVLVPSAVC